MRQEPADISDVGRRQRSKDERRSRIEDAARTAFRTKGFDGTTTREIAAIAGIGAGTLYAYSTSKHGLLRMVYRRDLEAVTAESFATLPQAGLLDRLEHIFRARFRFWGADPALSRHANLATFAAQYDARGMPDEERLELPLQRALRDLIAAAQACGELAKRDSPDLLVRLILDIYLTENREWILEAKPDVDRGVAKLRGVLGIALRDVLDSPLAENDKQMTELLTLAHELSPPALGELLRFARFRRAENESGA